MTDQPDADPDPHLGVRARFRRHRLPREYPSGIRPDVLRRRAVRTLGRSYGYEVLAFRAAGDDGPVTLRVKHLAERPA